MGKTFKIEDLAQALSSPAQGGHIDAGYTYLGQMISHDIVSPASTDHPRVVTPSLNLDSLYGETRQTPASAGSFCIHATQRDLLRNDGVAQIPEPRNDENVIVAQLHLFWLRLHNLLVTKEQIPFEDAQDKVVRLFQAVIIHDYLRQILAPKVYELYFVQADTSRFLGLDLNPLPDVFTRAAFRFGHSMVRSSYTLNQRGEQALTQLFQPNNDIPEEQLIDRWERLFGCPRGNESQLETQKAGRIDTKIVKEMTRIARPDATVDITVANLEAGVKAELPTGAAYTQQLLKGRNGKYYQQHLDLKLVDEIRTGNLSHLGGLTIDNIPLWPYFLMEAETFNDGRSGSLGVAGSLIVADVLRGSIASSAPSYLASGTLHQLLASMGSVGADIKKNMDSRSGDCREVCMDDLIRTVDPKEKS